jgi:ABC-type branched-subunit amino acid transport system substrate-binding protein
MGHLKIIKLKKYGRPSPGLPSSFLLAALLTAGLFFSAVTGWADEEPAPIILGMSTALTGPTAELGKRMLSGVMTGFERANREGGIKGRRLQLITLDDGYEPARTAPNMRRLIEKENVLAVIGNIGTPTAIASIPIFNSQKTLFFAPVTGAGVSRRNPPDRYVINFRASYSEEIAEMIDKLVHVVGLKPNEIAFFTQRDGYGDAGYAGGLAALQHHGLQDEKLILHVRYNRNTLAVENALANIFLADSLPKAIIMVGAYAPCAKFIKLAKDSGLDVLFLNVSFTGSEPLARILGKNTDGVIITQVVPHPFNTTLPIVRDYHDDLKQWEPSKSPSFLGLEGYIASRIFISALQKLEGEITREAVVDAVEELGEFDLGMGKPLLLGQDHHQASHYIWPTILVNGAFVPFNWGEIGVTMKQISAP